MNRCDDAMKTQTGTWRVKVWLQPAQEPELKIHMNHHHEGPEHQYSSSPSDWTLTLKVVDALKEPVESECRGSRGQEAGEGLSLVKSVSVGITAVVLCGLFHMLSCLVHMLCFTDLLGFDVAFWKRNLCSAGQFD